MSYRNRFQKKASLQQITSLVALTAVTLLLVFGTSSAEDDANCPSTAASNDGQTAFQKFHEVIAPVWHGSWPKQDYTAMFAAGPKFNAAFKPIDNMPVVFKTEVRARTFETNRIEFRRLVKEYSGACANMDSAKVYALLPELHDAFEQTASALLPVKYPEFEGFMVTLELIKDKHIPDNNIEGMIGSSQTLVSKMNELNEKTIPADLTEKKDAILAQFDEMRKIVDQIKVVSDKKDLVDLKVQIRLLDTVARKFQKRFL
ncbi:MAG TPA: hypothetical protein VJ983_00215 [candidate division Zixibacteria bacterium]|nr:hypothetical protein [candidate division Zixibacteria bacterium]